ncbi:hypothetical protein FACS1894151_07790 [Spirochaetia bacterium]|nr:hypothetical protein FACS1894151_07790 [Spirochaetia bacterium]
MANKKLTGRQNAAIFFVSVGTEISSEIFKYLRKDEVETLTFEIALLEFDDDDKIGGIDFAREVLETAFGALKAIDIINRLTDSLQVRMVDNSEQIDDLPFLLDLIQQKQRDHSQVVPLILAYLEPAIASQILSSFPQEIQSDVTRRIAAMDRTNPKFLHEMAKEHPEDVAQLIKAWLRIW